MKQVIIMFIFSFLTTCSAKGQDIPVIPAGPQYDLPLYEQKLGEIYSQWILATTTHDTSSDDFLDSTFAIGLTDMITATDKSFYYPFEEMTRNEMISLFTSNDSLLRIYNWDKFSRTSMREAYTIYQLTNKDKVVSILGKKSKKDGSLEPTFDKVAALYTISIAGKNHYFVVRNTILSSNDYTQSIECMTIEKGQLKRNVPIFKTKTKVLGSIDFNFLRASLNDPVAGIDAERDAYNLIVYDKEKQQILIPVVNKEMEVQASYLTYQLNGNFFEYIGIKK